MNWYYAEKNQPVGPMPEEAFQKLVASGTITGQTLVWHEGMAAWAAYGQLAASNAPAPASTSAAIPAAATAAYGTSICCECRRSFPLADMIQYQGVMVCAQCKPAFFQRVQEGAETPGVLSYGGFWIRFAAKFIDGMILGAVSVLLTLTVGGAAFGAALSNRPAMGIGLQVVLQLLQIAIGVSYTVFFLGKYGATPGKMACRLRVVRSDGSKITNGRAAGRYFAEMLSSLILCIGYIMAAFDDEKRALHDRICDTRVIRID